MKPINIRTFAEELAAQGLAGSCSFSAAGNISFPDDTPEEIKGVVFQLYEKHDPSAAQRSDARRKALASINTSCERMIAAIQAAYPASEVLSWPKQETEARAYIANSSAATPLLDALAQTRGIDKAELAARVILKADAFAQLSGAAIGKRQALEDALNALPADATVEQIGAIAW